MTCIVGYEFKGNVWIGSDSCVGDIDRYQTEIVDRSKLIGLNIGGEPALIGYTTSFRMADILENCSFKKVKSHKNNLKTLFRFIEVMRAQFLRHGFLQKKDAAESGGTFLIGFRGKLYRVSDDFCITRMTSGFAACGCGEPYALGAFSVMDKYAKKSAPSFLIESVLRAASEYSAYVVGPFYVRLLGNHNDICIVPADNKTVITRWVD